MEKVTVTSHTEKHLKTKRIICYAFGILEILLAFRFVLKLLGAAPESSFVSFIYTLSGIFIAPFALIFRTVESQGIETKAVLEPANLIAMAVYGIIAYGIIRLIGILATPKTEVTDIETKENNE